MVSRKTNASSIVFEATELLRHRGYGNTSMADIGKACGLLKGSIYHYFDSKEELIKAVIQTLLDEFKTTVFAIAYDEQKTPAIRLQEMMFVIERYYVDKRGCVLAVLAMETETEAPAVHQNIRSFFQEWVNTLRYVLGKHYEEDEARALAEDAVARLEGAVLWMRVTQGDENPLHRAAKGISSLIP